jgi:hypothetical protein
MDLRTTISLLPTWGPYEAAILRWSIVFGRPAPPPTEVGRLNPRFVEWMMGFPEGWVTDFILPGKISRTGALRCLGNAVVPQQARLAAQILGLLGGGERN